MVGEVAVEIHPVGDGDLSVAVVVAQVLAPQPLIGEGVLIAVGVGHRYDPHLNAVEQVCYAGV